MTYNNAGLETKKAVFSGNYSIHEEICVQSCVWEVPRVPVGSLLLRPIGSSQGSQLLQVSG